MKLSELLRDTEVLSSDCDLECDIPQIASDSRSVLRGGLFICIKGERADGHDHISEAVQRGAAVVVIENVKVLPCDVPHVLVRSTRLAEAQIWNRWYSRPADGMNVIAVTGTNGKTSTVFMLREIFKAAHKRVGIITTVKCMAGDELLGTFGGSSVSDAFGAMTTPDPEYLYGTVYMMKQKGVDTLIFEASSHALAQFKIDPIKVNIGVFTNLSPEHLDFHGDLERYFAAKARLASLSKICVINADDRYMAKLRSIVTSARLITCSANYGLHEDINADVTALRRIYNGFSGVEYIYFSKNAVFRQTSPIPGVFTVYNTMLASAAAMAAGADAEAVRQGISSLKSIDGRMAEVDLGRDDLPFRVFIDYAHTPAALESLLVSVREVRQQGQKITLLFGCGGDRDRAKRRLMGAVASRLADFVIITGDNSRSEKPESIIRDILPGIDLEKPYTVIADRKEAIEYAIKEAVSQEIILLAGKGHEKYEITSKGKIPFDEAEIVRNAVKKYRS